MKKLGARLFPAVIGLAASLCLPAASWATEGYFQLGYSPVQNALGGAGVANSQDAMSMALNPAGIVNVGKQFQMGVGLFMPYRGYTGTGTPRCVAPGTYRKFRQSLPHAQHGLQPSDRCEFRGRHRALRQWRHEHDLQERHQRPAQGGVFCAGDTGVDLMQMFISADYARRMGKFSFGIAPTLAVQTFKAKGLAAFAQISANSSNLTNRGYDWSYRRRPARRSRIRRHPAIPYRLCRPDEDVDDQVRQVCRPLRRPGRLRHPRLDHRRLRL